MMQDPRQHDDTIEAVLEMASEASLTDVPAVFQHLHRLGGTPTETEAVLKALSKASDVSIRAVRQQWRDHLTSLEEAPLERDGNGRLLQLDDPDPWPEPVDGCELLSELVSTLRRYVATTDESLAAVALWVMFAHAHDAATISPLLAICSPEKRCGKTTLLTLVRCLVPRPLSTSNISTAAIFRSVEEYAPTLLIDEADTFLKSKDDMVGVLNTGHHRTGAYVVRTVGDDHNVRAFATWCPKAVALIGALPTTLEDRSIVVHMRRRAAGEQVERLRLDRIQDELEPLRRKACRWANDNADGLCGAEPDVPQEISSDRARDNWRSLLAIADAAGSPWAERAKAAAASLESVEPDAESLGVTLLGDLRGVFASKNTDRLESYKILDELASMEERPWPELSRGKPMSPTQLARKLKPFGIRPEKWRAHGSTKRGYVRASCEDAFGRYLGKEGHQPATHATAR